MGSIASSKGAGRIPTLPALDGIRALAIAAVVTYHGDIYWVPGGLLGVEVFFVLSGYLITSLLWSELRGSSGIGFADFLMRRARRLLPALFVMLALVSAVFVIGLPDEVGRIRGDVGAAATYTSNWYLIGTDHSYFATFERPSPFGHLWSLAIEEQFYLLWPPVLFLLWKVLRRPKRVVTAIAGGAAASVAGLFLLYGGGDPSRVYYGTDTRAAGLLIGAALAIMWRPWAQAEPQTRIPGWALDAATVSSLGFLVYSFMRFDDLSSITYRPGLLLVALATAVLIASAVHPGSRLAKRLGSAPLRWLGKRSYSVYIWYFPVFVLTRPGVDYDITIGTAFAIRVAATITLAELSYRFIEEPIRHGALGRLIDRLKERLRAPEPVDRRLAMRLGGAGVAAMTLFATLAVAIIQAPLPLAVSTQPSSSAARLDWIEGIELDSAPAPLADRPVIAIGDSVMVSARAALRERFGHIAVDARVARQLPEGIARLEAYRDAGKLGRVVIIHLGNNGRFTTPQFERIMRVLSNVERVLFVNVKVPRRWEASVNQVIAAGVSRHSGRAFLVSWRRLSRDCPGQVFGSDATHVTPHGAKCYAKLIAVTAAAAAA